MGKRGVRHMGEMGSLRKKELNSEIWGKGGVRHMGEMGCLGGEIKILNLLVECTRHQVDAVERDDDGLRAELVPRHLAGWSGGVEWRGGVEGWSGGVEWGWGRGGCRGGIGVG